MWSQTSFLTIMLDIVGIISITGAGIVVVRSSVTKETVNELKDLADAQRKRLDDFAAQQDIDRKERSDLQQRIGELQGQINAYKDLPLKEIAESMLHIKQENTKQLDVLNNVLERQNDMLKVLANNIPSVVSATAAAVGAKA